MIQSSLAIKKRSSRRKYLLYLTWIVLFYPILKFTGFKVPKKPEYVAIHKKLPLGGYIVHKNFFLFDRQDTCWALSRRCTHLGCKLNYIEERDVIECPCHQSQFNAQTGKVIRGPAQKPLDFLPVEKREDDPLYVVTT